MSREDCILPNYILKKGPVPVQTRMYCSLWHVLEHLQLPHVLQIIRTYIVSFFITRNSLDRFYINWQKSTGSLPKYVHPAYLVLIYVPKEGFLLYLKSTSGKLCLPDILGFWTFFLSVSSLSKTAFFRSSYGRKQTSLTHYLLFSGTPITHRLYFCVTVQYESMNLLDRSIYLFIYLF